jgi:hypothetical protein
MQYKILLSLYYVPTNVDQQAKAAESLTLNNWKQVPNSDLNWITDVIAIDLLSAKFRVERDLQRLFNASNLPEISYAFQLSLGEVSIGTMKSENI